MVAVISADLPVTFPGKPLFHATLPTAVTWLRTTLFLALGFLSSHAASSATGNIDAPGRIVVEVKFDNGGKVEACRVLRSNAPFDLEASAIDHIRKHWNLPFLAGQTEIVPIVFDDASVRWDGDMAPPPNLFSDVEHEHTMKLRVSFGDDGWAREVNVVDSSGDDTVDRQTAIWVRVHWHHKAFSNQVMDAPFRFTPIVAAPAPALPKPKAIAPAHLPAQEPAPIPAIRAM